jgi:biotin carboxyl carrier protein
MKLSFCFAGRLWPLDRLQATVFKSSFEQVLEFKFDRNTPQAYSFEPIVGRETTRNVIGSPMMGMILKVNVAVGDRIKAGDVAATLESMKMELRFCSQTDGAVSAVNCRAGETFERNAVVVIIDPCG